MKHFSPFQCDQKRILRPTRMNHGGKGRTFLHVDLDAFFASVEQIKNPKLKGKPVVVGGRSSKRGVVTAASYEAKRRGIKTGMPWQQARACCPEAIFLPADFDAYAIYSRLVRKILEKMSPKDVIYTFENFSNLQTKAVLKMISPDSFQTSVPKTHHAFLLFCFFLKETGTLPRQALEEAIKQRQRGDVAEKSLEILRYF